jgi:mono/diheme cytochrome c family protein
MKLRAPILIATLALGASGCWERMLDQPKYEAYEASDFFRDGRASRPRIPGTVARGQLELIGPAMAPAEAPDANMLARGRERYNIYCAPCHDQVGRGEGVIVRRGFKRPPSFHEERLRTVTDDHFYQVITNGFGAMAAYGSRVRVPDRWAIVAYIRALQLSQNAQLGDVPDDQRRALEESER